MHSACTPRAQLADVKKRVRGLVEEQQQREEGMAGDRHSAESQAARMRETRQSLDGLKDKLCALADSRTQDTGMSLLQSNSNSSLRGVLS